jgi:hypothetical protein
MDARVIKLIVRKIVRFIASLLNRFKVMDRLDGGEENLKIYQITVPDDHPLSFNTSVVGKATPLFK